ncbi:GNAT family N-acetyltransferase [Rivularia sp. UHCC 0363]|uniref:GNAT family N-acetyltransferase n=1 Tax=Rivularia sp. UHCC 0363 TaxID=3110244 RepID=UPI002B1EF597|nr:GNAT family N-acetyltransferase [Rivularia sp. UHCC 0363]MEA5596323.1 GNAT family N-acetyltransferase [Rivularia sp. UHCC 0363]
MLISSERLTFREFVIEDWQAVLAYQCDSRYLQFDESDNRDRADVEAFVQMFLDQQKQLPRIKFQLALILKSENKLIGNCGIRKQNIESQEAELGYEISPDYWGQGYATEAASTILKFGFEKLKLCRIWSHCIAENTASRKVLQKVGMKFKRKLLKHEFFKNRYWDTWEFEITKDEWLNQ